MPLRRFLLCALIIATLPVLPAQAGVVAGVGKPAPDFTLTDMDGISHTLSDYQGKVVMLMIIGYG